MLLHASQAINHGNSKIFIQTVDTDVVVLGVSVAQDFSLNINWLTFGARKSLQYLSAH